jgi:hypothetical protein
MAWPLCEASPHHAGVQWFCKLKFHVLSIAIFYFYFVLFVHVDFPIPCFSFLHRSMGRKGVEATIHGLRPGCKTRLQLFSKPFALFDLDCALVFVVDADWGRVGGVPFRIG